MEMPAIFSPGLGTNTRGSLHFGADMGTLGYDPARIIISKHGGFPTNSEQIKINFILNPPPNKAARMKFYIVQYPTNQAYQTILYEGSYTNYFLTLEEDTTEGNTLSLNFANLAPQQQSTMTLRKKYLWDVKSSSAISVKLKNLAYGFDIDSMSSISCQDYYVDWYKSVYTFFLVPDDDTDGSDNDIICSGFVFDSKGGIVEVETKIFLAGEKGQSSSSATKTIGVYQITSDSLTVTRGADDQDNSNSINLYTFIYSPGEFIMNTDGYLILTTPDRVDTIPGMTEYATFKGLEDYENGLSSTAVQFSLTSDGIKIAGYSTFTITDGSFQISIFLKNLPTGSGQFRIDFYDKNDQLCAYSTPTSGFTVSDTEPPFKEGEIESFLTDTIDVLAGEQYKLMFRLIFNNNIVHTGNPANEGSIQIFLPNEFTSTLFDPVCKYSKADGTQRVWAPCTLTTGSIIKISIVPGFNIMASDDILITVTTDGADSKQLGIFRPTNTSKLYIFNIKVLMGTVVLESAFVSNIIYPQSALINVKFHSNNLEEFSVIEVAFDTVTSLTPKDFILIELTTNDGISQVFPDELGQSPSSDKHIMGDCARHPASTVMSSNVKLNCYITPGKGTANPPIPAKIKVSLAKAINNGGTLRFFVANIKNPGVTSYGGYVISLVRPCRDDGLGCPLMRKRYYIRFETLPVENFHHTFVRPVVENSKQRLLETQAMVDFEINLLNPLTINEIFFLKYPTELITIQNECVSPIGNCIHFERIGWTLVLPSAGLPVGLNTIRLKMDNANFFDRQGILNFTGIVYDGSGTKEVWEFLHPDYALLTPILQTQATQSNPINQLVLTNYDNIIKLSMAGIWRNENIAKIEIDVPSDYVDPNDKYCLAGIDLNDISSPTYTELYCQKYSDRKLIIVINKPWDISYSVKDVVIYFRGFVPLEASTGVISNFRVTSFTDLTNNFVVGENNFQLTISTMNFSSSPCTNSNQYLYTNGSCLDACVFPYLKRIISKNKFCEIPCEPSQFFHNNTSCINFCPPPMTIEIYDKIAICHNPCGLGTFYILSEKTCVADCTPPYKINTTGLYPQCYLVPNQKTVEMIAEFSNSLGTATTAGLFVSTIITPSNPTAAIIGSLAKIIEYSRYLNVSHSDALERMFHLEANPPGDVPMGPNMPPEIENTIECNQLPFMFAKYEIHCSFMVNQWDTLVSLVLMCLLVIGIWIVKYIVIRKNIRRIFLTIIEKISLFSFNFVLGQFYGSVTDTFFFGALELRGARFNSFLSILSFFLVVGLFIGSLILFFHHFQLIRNYQKIKKDKQVQRENKPNNEPGQLTLFNLKYKKTQILYKEFNDDSFLPQAFLLIINVRGVLFNFAITLLFEHPIVQCIFSLILTILIIFYLIKTRPLTSKLDFAQQIAFEIIILAVNVSLCVMALMDTVGSKESRENISSVIIYASMIFQVCGIVFLLPRLITEIRGSYLNIKAFYVKYKEDTAKRTSKLDTQHSIQLSDLNQTNNILLINEGQNKLKTIPDEISLFNHQTEASQASPNSMNYLRKSEFHLDVLRSQNSNQPINFKRTFYRPNRNTSIHRKNDDKDIQEIDFQEIIRIVDLSQPTLHSQSNINLSETNRLEAESPLFRGRKNEDRTDNILKKLNPEEEKASIQETRKSKNIVRFSQNQAEDSTNSLKNGLLCRLQSVYLKKKYKNKLYNNNKQKETKPRANVANIFPNSPEISLEIQSQKNITSLSNSSKIDVRESVQESREINGNINEEVQNSLLRNLKSVYLKRKYRYNQGSETLNKGLSRATNDVPKISLDPISQDKLNEQSIQTEPKNFLTPIEQIEHIECKANAKKLGILKARISQIKQMKESGSEIPELSLATINDRTEELFLALNNKNKANQLRTKSQPRVLPISDAEETNIEICSKIKPIIMSEKEIQEMSLYGINDKTEELVQALKSKGKPQDLHNQETNKSEIKSQQPFRFKI